MTQPLPEALAAYFAAKNSHDIDAMLRPFAGTAIVRDEGKQMKGRAEIRAWMEETTAKYSVTVQVQNVEQTADRFAVSGLVSGNFPGSPATLGFRFALADGQISALEIG
jgi:ketosteroid isomerase-like protein